MEISELVTKLVLDASGFRSGQVQANASLKAMGEGATRTGQDVAKVAQTMVQGFARVRTELLGLLGLFVATKSITSLTSEITVQDAALGRLSSRLGVAAGDLSAWDRAAQSAGAKAGDATGSVVGMSAALEKFRLTGAGGDTFIPWLSRLGAHMRNANGEMKNATEQQLELARVFQAMDRIDPRATDFYASQLPGSSQGHTDFLRRGPEFVRQRLDKQRAIGLPTAQDARNAQDILEQLGYVDQRMSTFGRHLLNDVSPGITRILTRLGDWLDQRLPGWYAKIDPIIQGFMHRLDGLDFDRVAGEVETFGKRVWSAFDALANWQPPAWMEWIKGQLYGENGKPGEGKQGADYHGEGFIQKLTDGSFFGQNNYQPRGTKADDVEMAAADRNGVPQDFARKIFTMEKGLDADGRPLTSKAGAIGAGQLMPGTAKELGVDPHDLAQNADGSTRYMKQLIDQFHGNLAAAAAAYNAGPNNPGVKQFAATGDTSGLPSETRDYVEKFNRRWFEAGTSGRNAGLKPLDHDGGFWDGLRSPPADLNTPRAPWVRPPLPVWQPVAPIPKLAEDGRDQPGDGATEKPDMDGLKRFLNGQQRPKPANTDVAPVGAGAFLVMNAQRRWGGTVHNTSHHDNSSETTINGGVHVHTQAKDAKGIARDIGRELKSRNHAAQANRGLS